jgi:nucleotide-binding universal stress UspA family protein
MHAIAGKRRASWLVGGGTWLARLRCMSAEHSQVVIGFDFTPSARAAMYRAIAVANRAPFHILHFLCAIEPHGQVPRMPHHGRVDLAYVEHVEKALLDEITAELRGAAIADRVHFFVHVRIGRAAEEILELARDVGADLIIVGSKGLTGVERLVLGSVAERVVREAGCTVEVARPKTYEHVELLDVSKAEHPHHYTPPHRYTYRSSCVNLRPDEWPLY